ncbi:glutamine--fructose-6-phosphate transaminase (isomerizing) [Williamsia sp. CHRR-6]|uniref:glutamine--fructose-6-phosphate transaminase (isomerizing) n=1 Tax=Williamsia sp. CHRR-6 TaxID=2835871 RepID=UPI001BDB5D66|nr:glutamine--fructose-6-phosphate transaminase (isomerizing) [Williamsia sp. CHRR-6]MBT0566607.1 glutamine--fructose-6-phosphate transaminase (isomerizing) [Williamsia sp. CHRR-6]
MCGIVGYIGSRPARPFLVEGLTRLEYRGYDSAGVAVLGASGTTVVKQVGRVRQLEQTLPKRMAGKLGIGHTRWATHGPATAANAHPHQGAAGRIALVHNGIIDNAAGLRAQLTESGIALSSDTDTEVLAHLIERSAADTLEDAVLDALERVTGTYALAVIDTAHPDRIVVARSGSPLILGVGSGEMLIASDLAALVRHTNQVVHLDDGELATVTAGGFATFDRSRTATERQPVEIAVAAEDLEHSGYETYLLKELHEQPAAAELVMRGRLDERFATTRLDGLRMDPRELRSFTRVKILGCGSAYYIGQFGAQLIEDLARIPADAEPASEFRYRQPIIEPSTLYVVVSQSGETADTAFAVAEIRRKGGRVVGLVNVVGSTIARAVDGGIYLHAGPEISVASTKALTNMGVAFALLAVHLGRLHDLSFADGQRILAALHRLPGQIEQILGDDGAIAAIAARLAGARSALYIGRVRGFPVAREGAQKLKEISYIHAEAYQTSELKHGPLALIDPDLPTVAVIGDDALTDRNIAAAQQVLARGGPVYAITHPGVDLAHLPVETIVVPKSEPELDPLLMIIPTQLLAYHAAVALGRDVDKPRNLAKSVTVE